MSTNWDGLCEFMSKNSFQTYYVFEDSIGIQSIIPVGSEDFANKFFQIKQLDKYRIFAIKPTPQQEREMGKLMKLSRWEKLSTLIEEIKLKHILNEQF